MPTINQLIRKGRKTLESSKTSPALKGNRKKDFRVF